MSFLVGKLSTFCTLELVESATLGARRKLGVNFFLQDSGDFFRTNFVVENFIGILCLDVGTIETTLDLGEK